MPEIDFPTRSSWVKAGAKENSGQPQILIEQATLIQPDGDPQDGFFYRILVQDSHDAAFSKPLAHKDIIGKSSADIVEMAESISDASRNVVGYARDRMTGIWINKTFHTWEEVGT